MNRSGFSLIEVILATAILLASVVVLSELAGIGRRQSTRATIETRAQEVCQRVLHELLLGKRPLVDVQDEPLLPPERELADRRERSASEQIEDDQLLIFTDPDEPSFSAGAVDEVQPKWIYTVTIDSLEQAPGLARLSVSVTEADPSQQRPIRFRLTRWIPAPDTPEFEVNPLASGLPGVGP